MTAQAEGRPSQAQGVAKSSPQAQAEAAAAREARLREQAASVAEALAAMGLCKVGLHHSEVRDRQGRPGESTGRRARRAACRQPPLRAVRLNCSAPCNPQDTDGGAYVVVNRAEDWSQMTLSPGDEDDRRRAHKALLVFVSWCTSQLGFPDPSDEEAWRVGGLRQAGCVVACSTAQSCLIDCPAMHYARQP